ncbi:MAG: hypothetical protein K8I30_01350, partial [Anaerolineae bacterium]|nr:hypothetical protein [Anaerolineae bacterium]
MPRYPSCYTSPKLEIRDIPGKGFRGVFAREFIQVGELLALYGGELIDGAILAALPPADQVHILQVEDDLYLAPWQT